MQNTIEKKNLYIMFSDIKGFSKLGELAISTYSIDFINYIFDGLKKISIKPLVWNTWGDATFAACESPDDIIKLCFCYRDLFAQFDFASNSMATLRPRIACHFGEATIIDDPLLGKKNLFGVNINAAARLEPATRPGEIFVTNDFKHQIENSPSFSQTIYFDTVGKIVLAKGFGEIQAYRLRKRTEKPQAIDWLRSIDLKKTLPEPPCQGKLVSHTAFKAATLSKVKQAIPILLQQPEAICGDIYEAAKIYKDFGLYEESIALIDQLEKYEIQVDSIGIFPFRSAEAAQKIKANCLTRLGRYEEAVNIIYSLWESGHKDSDTLSMVAAQYKRRAIYGRGVSVKKIEDIDRELIDRSKDLYLEALRMDLDGYYPAINAAYLYKIFYKEEGSGSKIASYISDAWGNRQGESWWLDATLAEAEMLHDDIVSSRQQLMEAIKRHNPPQFELMSTYEQISIYAQLTSQQKELQGILTLLAENIDTDKENKSR
jgi:class 3 adenylate cyclase